MLTDSTVIVKITVASTVKSGRFFQRLPNYIFVLLVRVQIDLKYRLPISGSVALISVSHNLGYSKLILGGQ
ncbi:hypothetical protein [Methylobacter luteus]|uniref:hypothetical protein n=1 Tax=Methylobacter luteus TaxID=415 RepID=UPI0004824D31|nr:hypothetical protein [Methylobacter luteus]